MSVCETCHGTGVYHTGAFIGDDEDNLKSIMKRCPDCESNSVDDKNKRLKAQKLPRVR